MSAIVDGNTIIFILGVVALVYKSFHDHHEIGRRLGVIEDYLGIGKPKAKK